MDTAMEASVWKEEPLSPFSGLEDQIDLWDFFDDEVAKQAQSPIGDPLETLGSQGGWLPDSPGDSCDSLENQKLEDVLQARAHAQLATQLLQHLDEDLIKDEPFADTWYEQKQDLPMYDDLPSPTPSLGKEGDGSLAGAALRPFAGLTLSMPLHGYATVTTAPAFASPAAPAAVLVPLGVQQQQQLQPPLADSLQQLQQPQQQQHLLSGHHHVGLLATVSLPLQQQLQPLGTAAIPVPQPHPLDVVHDTQTLLQEFDFVFGKVEQSHGGALTPPQSPPHQQYAAASPVEYQRPSCLPVQPLQPLEDCYAALTPNQQQQQLIREVDELVSTRVQQVQQVQQTQQAEEVWSSLGSLAPPSPCTSSSSSSSSCSTDSPAPASPETDDPDWFPGGPDSPEDEEEQARGPAKPAKAPGKAAPARKRGTKRSAKPYSHEDKRMRKKEQNKNAATRYRMKKKAEVEEILGEENELQQRNDDLKTKVADLSQEIRYLKNLMREVFERRGLLSK